MNKKRGSVFKPSGDDRKTRFTIDQISKYYLELEHLLDHIERSSTHYQVLRLERSATGEEIKLAYKQVVTWLHPSYNRASFVLLGDIQQRIDRALQKVSLAFSVLTNFGKKVEYDNSLSPRKSGPLPVIIPGLHERPINAPSKMASDQQVAALAASDESLIIKPQPLQQPLYSKPVDDLENLNRRRCERTKTSMPVRVSGYDQTGCNWHDVAQTVDVSRIGVALRMARRVRHGMVLHLTLPLPTRMRSHGYADQNYSVYAVVRRMGSPLGRARIVGLEFLGENPPTGYLDEPWATFQTANWSGPDRRREPREPNSDAVIIDFLNESMQPIGHELGTTENVSPSGMRVYVKVAIPQCDFVKVTDLKSDSEKVAAVRNQYVGQDGFERLCLQFVQAS